MDQFEDKLRLSVARGVARTLWSDCEKTRLQEIEMNARLGHPPDYMRGSLVVQVRWDKLQLLCEALLGVDSGHG
jgi:hypothetical protein